MTEEQFIEEVEAALERHISRDPTVAPEDQEWETRNAAAMLAKRLRLWNRQIPEVADGNQRSQS